MTKVFQGPAVSVYTNRGEHGPAMINRLEELAAYRAKLLKKLELRFHELMTTCTSIVPLYLDFGDGAERGRG